MSLPATELSNAAATNVEELKVYDGLTIRLKPAPLIKRGLAHAVDLAIIGSAVYALILLLLFLGVGFVVGLQEIIKGSEKAAGVGAIILLTLVVLGVMSAAHLYYIRFEFKRGATPGKRLFGLKVISLRGSSLTLGQCVMRELFRYVDLMFYLPGPISCLVTERRQRLGDLAAGTLVVYSRETEEREQGAFTYISQSDYHLLKESLAPKAVEPDLCRDLLSFTHPVFVMGSRQALPHELERWELYARSTFGADSSAVDGRTVLLFFAEHCVQTLNHSDS